MALQQLPHQIFPPNAAVSVRSQRRSTATAHDDRTFARRKISLESKSSRCGGTTSHISHKNKFRLAVGSVMGLKDGDYWPPTSTVDMQRLVDFLYDDLPHVFDDQGIDQTVYDERVKFRDPITKHDSLGGYLFNIAFLKMLFNPKLQLHWVKQTGQYEISTRWTVVMEYILLPWKPKLVLTGTSIMGINPETGKFCSHVDIWDSIRDNNYFSLEGIWDIFKQMWIYWIYRTPDSGKPKYHILKRMPNYEVRRYAPSVPIKGMNLEDTNQETVKNSRTMRELNAAVINFLGEPTKEIVLKKEKILRSSLIADGLKPKAGCSLARYNGSKRTIWNLPMSNEVLIWLEEFTLD